MTVRDKTEILIAEDSPTQAEDLRYTLEKNGYNVRSARNGKEALELLNRSLPTIVVTDIMMPKMDGFQLCRVMKKDERFREIPVILLTALSEPQDVLKGLESGADNFITKPYDENYLLMRIHHVLVNTAIRRESKVRTGIEIYFKEKKYFITSEPQQILDLLLSTYETAVMKNHELQAAREELEILNGRLLAEVAERRLREEEVKKLNRDLRHRALQLEEANKDLESFSYSVSHDLKAPLRAMDGFSKILIDEHSDTLRGDSKHLLTLIRENARKMARLIDDILAFSRAGRKEIALTLIDTETMVREVIEEIGLSFANRTVRFDVKKLPSAMGDAASIRQVLVNLLSNAVKFTRPRESAFIEVGGEETADEIVYHVRDNGVGFTPEYADKLFGVFQRLHSTSEFEGTGIGLAIVKRVVGKLGGRVWAEGRPNEGATFYFTLPKSQNG